MKIVESKSLLVFPIDLNNLDRQLIINYLTDYQQIGIDEDNTKRIVIIQDKEVNIFYLTIERFDKVLKILEALKSNTLCKNVWELCI